MQQHDRFANLLLHDDAELAEAFGSPVVSRRLVHEWPLTSTEDVRLADGRRYAYKAQLEPTAETEFYARASTRLLPPFVDLGRSERTRFLATEWIDAATLHTTELSDLEFIGHARNVVRAISEVDGSPAVFLDLSTPGAIQAAADVTADRLSALILSGEYVELAAEVPARLRAWARSSAVRAALTDAPRVTHGDLSPEEVFLVGDGYRVIDWQRPVLGPPELDLVSLLRHRRIDPNDHVNPEIVELSWFVLMHWSALVHHDVLPEFDATIPEEWAVSAATHMFG